MPRMKLRASCAVLVLLFAAACGGSDEPTAKPTKSSSPTATEPAADAPLVVAPGRIGPVLVGMTIDEANATGLFQPRDTSKDEACKGAYASIQWKAPNTDDLLVGTFEDGKDTKAITVMGIRGSVKTSKGIGVGSTLGDLKAAYPDTKVEESTALGSTAFLRDGDNWLGLAFNETTDEIKNSSKVVFMEVTKGGKPDTYLDGCGY